MLYKTMVLGLLEQHPQLHQQLRKKRMLLPALECYARGLKASHEDLKRFLARENPGMDGGRIASTALEIALKELEDSLPDASAPDGSETFSLDAAMAYLRRHTPPA